MSKPEDVIAKVLSGEMTREEAIQHHPEMEDRVLLLAALANELKDLPRQKPSTEFRNMARLRLLQHIQATPRRRNVGERLLDSLTFVPLWATRLAAVLTAGGALTIGVSFASASALPNDALYPVKRAVERVQVAAARGDEAKANAYISLADQRAAEMAASAGNIDDAQLTMLVSDYGDALQGVGDLVDQIQTPSPQLVGAVQTHLASQATELEARALNSPSKPAVQKALTGAEVVASNVSDHVVMVSELRGKAGPNDIRLAANPAAVATAIAELSHSGSPLVPSPSTSSSAAVASAGSTTSVAPAASTAGGTTAVTLAGLNVLYDRAWNQIATASFMGKDVRLKLEQNVANAKLDTRDGRISEASSELDKATTTLKDAVKASQATEYTATQLNAQFAAIQGGLTGFKR